MASRNTCLLPVDRATAPAMVRSLDAAEAAVILHALAFGEVRLTDRHVIGVVAGIAWAG